jgi:hypothetical protein
MYLVLADANEGGMAEFMNAEMSNWGDASQSARSKRSTRTSRSVAKSKISSKASPRKSIRKYIFKSSNSTWHKPPLLK